MAGGAEREVKLGAEASFEMPGVDGLADGVTAASQEPEQLSTTYLDTDDLRLARWGASLRHRGGYGWTVKLPPEGDGMLLVRGEFTFEGGLDEPAPEALDLVRGYVRRAPLRAQATLETVRRRIELRDAEGRLVADLVDDDVSVLDGGRLTMRFRELEVEITDVTPPGLLDALVERLRAAGAGAPDRTSKYTRALGRRAGAPPELGPGPFADAVAGLVRCDAPARLDPAGEGAQRALAAVRRLREACPGDELCAELDWLAGALDGDPSATALRSDRYLVLLDRLVEAARALDRAR